MNLGLGAGVPYSFGYSEELAGFSGNPIRASENPDYVSKKDFVNTGAEKARSNADEVSRAQEGANNRDLEAQMEVESPASTLSFYLSDKEDIAQAQIRRRRDLIGKQSFVQPDNARTVSIVGQLPDDDEAVPKRVYQKTKFPVLPLEEAKLAHGAAAEKPTESKAEVVPTITVQSTSSVGYETDAESDADLSAPLQRYPSSLRTRNQGLIPRELEPFKLKSKDEDFEVSSMIAETGSTIAPESPRSRRPRFLKDPFELALPTFDLQQRIADANNESGKRSKKDIKACLPSPIRDYSDSDGIFADDELSAGDIEVHASHIENIPDCPSKSVFKEASSTVEHDRSLNREVEPLSTMLAEHLIGTDTPAMTTPNFLSELTGSTNEHTGAEFPFDQPSKIYNTANTMINTQDTPSVGDNQEANTMTHTEKTEPVAGIDEANTASLMVEQRNLAANDESLPSAPFQSTGKYVSSDEEDSDDENIKLVPVRAVFNVKGSRVCFGPTLGRSLGDSMPAARPLPVRDAAVVEKEREEERVKLLAGLQTPIETPFPRPITIQNSDGKFRCSDPRCEEPTFRSETGCNVYIQNHHSIPRMVGRPVNDILKIKPLNEKDRLALLSLYEATEARKRECLDLSRIGQELEKDNIRGSSTNYRDTGDYMKNNYDQMPTTMDPNFEYEDLDKENIEVKADKNVPQVDETERQRLALQAFDEELPRPYEDPEEASIQSAQSVVSTPCDEDTFSVLNNTIVDVKEPIIPVDKSEEELSLASQFGRFVSSNINDLGKNDVADNSSDMEPVDASTPKPSSENSFPLGERAQERFQTVVDTGKNLASSVRKSGKEAIQTGLSNLKQPLGEYSPQSAASGNENDRELSRTEVPIPENKASLTEKLQGGVSLIVDSGKAVAQEIINNVANINHTNSSGSGGNLGKAVLLGKAKEKMDRISDSDSGSGGGIPLTSANKDLSSDSDVGNGSDKSIPLRNTSKDRTHLGTKAPAAFSNKEEAPASFSDADGVAPAEALKKE